MSKTMPPGPGAELDALVVEKVLGWQWVAFGPYCYLVSADAADELVNRSGWHRGRRGEAEPISHRFTRYAHLVVPFVSADLSTAEAAAEEARKAGRIMGWVVSAETEPDDQPPTEFSASVAMKHNQHGTEYEIAWRAAYGDSPAHALALALLAACGGAE